MTVALTKNGVDRCTGSTLESALYLLFQMVNFHQWVFKIERRKKFRYLLVVSRFRKCLQLRVL